MLGLFQAKTELLSARKQLPSAPRTVRDAEDFDLSEVPTDPPFQAFVNNIPFTASEDHIYDILKDCQVRRTSVYSSCHLYL